MKGITMKSRHIAMIAAVMLALSLLAGCGRPPAATASPTLKATATLEPEITQGKTATQDTAGALTTMPEAATVSP